MAIIEHETSIQQDVKPAHVDEVGQVLLDAADVLRRDGWCRGRGMDEAGRHCALGAIGVVALPSVGLSMAAADRVEDSLGLRVKNIGLGFWNDRQSGPEPVIEAMTRAAYGL